MSFKSNPIHLNDDTVMLLSIFLKEGDSSDLLYLYGEESFDKYMNNIQMNAAKELVDKIGDNACDEFYYQLILKCLEKISNGTSTSIIDDKEESFFKYVLKKINEYYESI